MIFWTFELLKENIVVGLVKPVGFESGVIIKKATKKAI